MNLNNGHGRDAGSVNPLRPYYIPPSVGVPKDVPTPAIPPSPFNKYASPATAASTSTTTATAASPLAPNANAFAHPGLVAGAGANATAAAKLKYASKARDIFGDLDYKDYIAEPSPSVVQTAKELIDELMWKYTSVMMAQPFEVAKTLLQIRLQDHVGGLAAAAAAEAKAAKEEAEAKTRTPPPQHQHRHRRRASSIADQEQTDPGMYDEGVWDEKMPDSDSEPDENTYFSSNAPTTPTPSYPSRQSRQQRYPPQDDPQATPRPIPPSSPAPKAVLPAHQLAVRTPFSVLEVVSQLWQKEGAWGVWKGANATFVYSVLQGLLENWSRSVLSAMFNVPDLGISDDIERIIDMASPYPWASLLVAAGAAVATALILSPLDLVRTRLIVTPTSRAPRRMLSTLRNLPSYICPSALLAPTILHGMTHPLLTLSTPLILRTRFMLQRDTSPVVFSIAKFLSASAALFVRLPLETALRRGQVAVLATPAYMRPFSLSPPPPPPTPTITGGRPSKRLAGQQAVEELETVVPPGKFDGIVGTWYGIVAEEGSRAVAAPALRPSSVRAKRAARANNNNNNNNNSDNSSAKAAEMVFRRGQGLEGLWRGWKVSWWGMVGLWASSVLGGGGDGQF